MHLLLKGNNINYKCLKTKLPGKYLDTRRLKKVGNIRHYNFVGYARIGHTARMEEEMQNTYRVSVVNALQKWPPGR